jgi:thymidylate synthase
MRNGTDQLNTRTGKICRAIVGKQIVYDVYEKFPAVTTKKLAFKESKGEVLGFFRGYDNAADFRAIGCHIWDKNANETKAWLENPYRKGIDDLGRIYGVQWTRWRDTRLVGFDMFNTLVPGSDYKCLGHIVNPETNSTQWIIQREINQLENALRTIITNPSDRRIIISAWNVAELDMMALVPCHMDYLFVPFEDTKVLHLVMRIRSWDIFLGAPFNIASTALILSIMAKLSGYTPGTITIQATNAHAYSDHFDQIVEQLTREHFELPVLKLSDNVKTVTDMSEIKGIFTRIEPDDIWLEGYASHAAIKAPMAA